MSATVSRWFNPVLASTINLSGTVFSDLCRTATPAVAGQTFGMLLLAGNNEAWKWVVEEKDADCFASVGTRRALEESYDDLNRSRFEAMWDLCRYLDQELQAADHPERLQNLLNLALRLELGRVSGSGSNSSGGSFLRAGSCFVRTFTVYMVNKILTAHQERFRVEGEIRDLQAEPQLPLQTAAIQQDQAEKKFDLPLGLEPILNVVKEYAEGAVRKKRGYAEMTPITEALDQAEVLSNISYCLDIGIGGTLYNNKLADFKPFKWVLYGQEKMIDPMAKQRAAQAMQRQCAAESNARKTKPLPTLEIQEAWQAGSSGVLLVLFKDRIDTLMQGKQLKKAEKLKKAIEAIYAQFNAIEDQLKNIKYLTPSDVMFTYLKSELKNKNSPLRKAMRETAGFFSFFRSSFEKKVLSELLHLEVSHTKVRSLSRKSSRSLVKGNIGSPSPVSSSQPTPGGQTPRSSVSDLSILECGAGSMASHELLAVPMEEDQLAGDKDQTAVMLYNVQTRELTGPYAENAF